MLETCLSVNNNSCGEWASSLESPISLGDNLNTTSVSFFTADLIYVTENSIILYLNSCIVSFYIIKIKIYKTFTVPWENSKIVSFSCLIVKKIVAFSSLSRFAVKLICWIFRESASNPCCLLKSIAIIL